LLSAALGATLLAVAGLAPVPAEPPANPPERVEISSGTLRLYALLWRPRGSPPFPAVVFNHGSGPRTEAEAEILGPLFARHGYVFLHPFRRGQGLSADQGPDSDALLLREGAAHGADARDRLQVRLLETDQLDDAIAAVAFVRSLPDVDPERVSAVGHSFGASLTLLLAEKDPRLHAAIAFAAAAASWPRSQPLQQRLLAAVRHSSVPTAFVCALNDHSIEPSRALSSAMEERGASSLLLLPAVGASAADGHRAVYGATDAWERDVFAFLDAHSAPGSQRTATEETAVRTALQRFLKAFEDLDWETFRASFADDATAFFPVPGWPDRSDGRAAIEERFRQVFAETRAAAPSGPPYHRLEPEQLAIQLVGPDAAVTSFHLRNDERIARRTIVFKRIDGAWRIAHLHASNVPKR
jgi:uncharacterized protein (TIGR02246 family)